MAISDDTHPIPHNGVIEPSPEELVSLEEWSGAAAIQPITVGIAATFSEQLRSTSPQTVAVESRDGHITYGELNVRANRLAHHLRSVYGITVGAPVAVALPRSLDLVVALLAIVKSGGAYVPLDANYPAARIQFILDDSKASLLITDHSFSGAVNPHGVPVLRLDGSPLLDQYHDTDPDHQSGPDDLAYIMYTSGSTGKPKGVCVPHRGVVRLVKDVNYAVFDSKLRFLQYAPVAFDAATLEIWAPLLNGGRLVLMDTVLPTLAQLGDFIRSNNINTLFLTTSLFNAILDSEAKSLLGVTQLLTGGEVSSPRHVAKALHVLPKTRLIHAYGPTENTTFTCCCTVTAQRDSDPVPIGRPISNTTVYILDAQAKPVPVGVAGELYTGGNGLALGYLNRPELSADSFVECHVFGRRELLYRTGDRARWRPDGMIEFIGRADDQVKLRGYRVELGEIEAALSTHPLVEQACVVVDERGLNKVLMGFVTLVESVHESLLVNYLKNLLPEPMLPSRILRIDRFPLTVNGKIDRIALLAINPTANAPKQFETATQQRLAELWDGLLPGTATSPNVQFLASGGNSLIAAQLAARIASRFKIECPVSALFSQESLANLAHWVDAQAERTGRSGAIPVADTDIATLSFSERTIWLRSKLDGKNHPHNVSMAWNLQGPVDVSLLGRAIEHVSRRHRILRTIYPLVNGEPRPVFAEHLTNPLTFVDLRHLPEIDRGPKLQEVLAANRETPFDLEVGPLQRTTLVTLGTANHMLLFAAHHIVVDSWSLGIWEREWQAIYKANVRGEKPSLRPLAIEYRDYAIWRNRQFASGQLAVHQRYWRQSLNGIPAVPQLPTDFQRPPRKQHDAGEARLTLAPKHRAQLHALATRSGCTLSTLLFSVFVIVLYRTANRSDWCIAVPVSDRTSDDTQHLIGLLLDLILLRIAVDGEQTFGDLLRRVTQHFLEAQNHANYPVEAVVAELPTISSNAFNPYFQILFNAVESLASESDGSFDLLGVTPYGDGIEVQQSVSNLDLILTAYLPKDGGLVLELLYDKALYEPLTATNLLHAMGSLFEQTLSNPKRLISEYTLPATVDASLYPLTIPQREIWLHQTLFPSLPLYNIGAVYYIDGEFDVEVFQKAINLLIEKHDALRLRLTDRRTPDGEPQQRVDKAFAYLLPVHDLTRNPNPKHAAASWIDANFSKPFCWQSGPLFRYALLHTGENSYQWVAQYHHLIADAWGGGFLSQSLAEIYSTLISGNPVLLSSAPYVDYIHADQGYRHSTRIEKDRRYWADRYAPEAALLLEQRRPADSHSHRVSAVLASREYEQWTETAKVCKATPFHLFIAVLALFLTRTSNSRDVTVGVPVLNRPGRKFKETAGLFAAVIPFRVTVHGNETIATLLGRIGRLLAADYRHQRAPLSDLFTVGTKERLYDVGLSYETAPIDAKFGDISSRHEPLFHGVEQTPLMLFVRVAGPSSEVKWNLIGNSAFFTQNELESTQRSLLRILRAVIMRPQALVGELTFYEENELNQIHQWRKTDWSNLPNHSIADAFNEVATRCPEQVAVEYGAEHLTYGTLSQKAERLASQLCGQYGIRRNTPIVIYMGRCLEMVVAMVAIAKAGGAYVPIDTGYPSARFREIVQDCDAEVVLVESGTEPGPETTGFAVIAVDVATLGADSAVGDRNTNSGPDDLAYIMYTSGTTGVAKGVCIPNRAVLRLVKLGHFATLDATQRFLHYAPIAFDAATLEIWGPLLNGGQLVIMDPGTPSLGQLGEFIRRRAITSLWLTSSLFNALLDERADDLRGVRQLLTGGEALSPHHVAKAIQMLPDTQIINGYGPTENTTFTCCYSITDQSPTASVPIGRPIGNTTVYILDHMGKPVPMGVAGELYTGGDGLASGYLNQPELSAERFVDMQVFGRRERLYRTGDRARWRDDGNIEFLGRIDNQVKVRGYRVELEELESILRRHPCVKDAAVVLTVHGENRSLHGFVTTDQDVSSATLRTYMSRFVPGPLIPVTIRVLEGLPLTRNGKVDRRRLMAERDEAARGEPPRSVNERLLAEIWAELLGNGSICREDDFFSSGGNSLLIMQLATRIHAKLGKDIPIAELYRCPVLREQARLLERVGDGHAPDGALYRQLRPQAMGEPPLFWMLGDRFQQVLERHLPTNQGVYLLMHQSMDGKPARHKSIGAMVGYYLDTIRTLWPHGPFRLGGFSFGAVLAYEVACRLSDDGFDDVELFLLSPSPLVGTETPISLEEIQDGKHDELLQRLSDTQRDQLAQCMVEDRRVPLELVWPYLLEIYNRSREGYRPSEYPGKVTLVFEEGVDVSSWRIAIEGELKLFGPVACSHLELGEERFAPLWVDKLVSLLAHSS